MITIIIMNWFTIQRLLKVIAFMFITYLILNILLSGKISPYENIYVCILIGIIFIAQDIFYPSVNISNKCA